MRPIAFEEATEIVGQEPDTIQIQRHRTEGSRGRQAGSYICVWRLSRWERIWLLWSGRIYQATESEEVVPQVMSVVRDQIIHQGASSASSQDDSRT